jgi:hypothetical protein
MAALAFDVVIRTFLEDVACDLEVGGGADGAILKGARDDAFILIHHQIIGSKCLLFCALVEIACRGAKHAFFLDGSLVSILVELEEVFKAQETDTLHGKTRDLIVIISTLKTSWFYRNHNSFQANTTGIHLPFILLFHSSLP